MEKWRLPLVPEEALDFVDTLDDLIVDQAEWSEKTFGADDVRGPRGTVKHLIKEAEEALEALDVGQERFVEEMADCFLLTLDAIRRGNSSFEELVEAAVAKLEVCKTRNYAKPTSDEPVEHFEPREDGWWFYRDNAEHIWSLLLVSDGGASGKWIRDTISLRNLKGEWLKPTEEQLKEVRNGQWWEGISEA